MTLRVAARICAGLFYCGLSTPTKAVPNERQVANVRRSLSDWIKADTSNPPGNEARVVKLIAARLEQAKIPYQVVAFAPGRENIVARLKGSGPDKPLLLLAHVDVVGTKDQAWTSPPHVLTEQDGYLVGRGVSDDLGMAAINLEVFLALKADRKPLRRDVILALTGDEESGGAGIRFLLDKHPQLVDAGIALNEGASVTLGDDGKVAYVGMQTAEKNYADFTVTATGPTGHSSVPPVDTAIFTLAKALVKINEVAMPAHLLPVTRAYFTEQAAFTSGEEQAAMQALVAATDDHQLPEAALAVLEKDPITKANLRTTCVATLISGGTKENALPPSATAMINCRILPDETVDEVRRRLVSAIANPAVSVNVIHDYGVPKTSPVDGEVAVALRAVTKQLYPGVPLLPVMSRGATDSRYLRRAGILAYGIGPIAMSELDGKRAHGINERIPAASIGPGLEFMLRLVDHLAVAR